MPFLLTIPALMSGWLFGSDDEEEEGLPWWAQLIGALVILGSLFGLLLYVAGQTGYLSGLFGIHRKTMDTIARVTESAFSAVVDLIPG